MTQVVYSSGLGKQTALVVKMVISLELVQGASALCNQFFQDVKEQPPILREKVISDGIQIYPWQISSDQV